MTATNSGRLPKATRKYREKRITRDPDYFKPKRYKHFLTLGELAVEVDKDPSWLKRLEAGDRIPRPTRVKRGQLEIRLYSPAQVEEIRMILKGHKRGRPR